jgi:isoaspartyl peptidase/L-asparaginase-like protein (Ntn-hydrolase superfamily)
MKQLKPVAISTWEFGFKPVQKAAELSQQDLPGLDVIAEAIKIAEDDPEVTSVGYGGFPNEDGIVELDACIFDGPRHLIGGVCCLQHIRNPIAVARLVLERTPHIILSGQGALDFALRNGFQQENLLTEKSRTASEEWKRQRAPAPDGEKPYFLGNDTICLLLRDCKGDLFGGCSTSGLAWKMPGRVGDTPMVGSGLYVDNDIGAAAATGVGELAISQCASFAVVELMRQMYDPGEACEIVLHRVLKKTELVRPRQLALIALRKDGKLGFACLSKGFQAPIYNEGKADLLEVNPIAFE